MALEKNVIAFGPIASVAAQHVVSVDAVHVTCIVDLRDGADALLCAQHVFAHHKHGDAYLLLHSKADELSEVYANVFEQFFLVDHAGENIPHTLLEITERHALNDEDGEHFITRQLRVLPFAVKNSHEHRNQKNGYFDVGWFTPGTVFGFSVDNYGPKKDELTYLCVDHVVSNGPDSFCVVSTTDADAAIGGKKSVNISHVKSIVRQVPGKVKWGVGRTETYRKKFFEESSLRWHFANVKPKHPSQYRSYDPSQLILHIAEPMVPNGQLLDIEKLTTLIVNENTFKRTIVNHECQFSRLVLHSVNKKRLKNTIRRMLNKCLMDVKQAQEDHEQMLAEIDDRDFEREAQYG